MNPNSALFVVAILAVSVAVSGCAGQSPASNTSAGGAGAQGPGGSGASASWCPEGRTTTLAAPGGQATIVWTFKGTSSYTFPDATVTVCCMDGQVTEQDKTIQVRMCVDQGSKHSVQFRAASGSRLVKFVEMYPKGGQTCTRLFSPEEGDLLSETCA